MKTAIAKYLAALILAGSAFAAPASAASTEKLPPVEKVSVEASESGIGFGFWANNRYSERVFDDFGRRPYERFGFFSWNSIERAPGQYDTHKIIEGVQLLHRLGTTPIISLNNISGPWFNRAKKSQIPAFYPQDITDQKTRAAGLRYIDRVIREVLEATGSLVVCFDYEMMWHCRPDTPEKQQLLHDWFLEAVAAARGAAAEIGLSEQLKIIPIVNGAVDTPTTLKLLNSPAENHTPARWLTDMVAVCDYLAIDSYDFDKEDPTNPEKTLRTLAFWIRNYSLGKPVLVTEFGYSTGVSYYPDYKTHYHATGTEEQQHDFYAALFPRLVEENRPGGLLNGQVRCFCLWMYSDISTKKSTPARENHFGMIRLDGSRKPSFELVHREIDAIESDPQSDPSRERARERLTDKQFGEGIAMRYCSGCDYDYLQFDTRECPAGTYTVTVKYAHPGALLIHSAGKWYRSTDDQRTHSLTVEVDGEGLQLYATGSRFPFEQRIEKIEWRHNDNTAER